MLMVGAAAGPLMSERHVFWVAVGTGVIAVVVVLLPLLLAWSYRVKKVSAAGSGATGAGSAQGRSSFFEIPYITWFLVHFAVAVLAIAAIVLLGVDNVIDKGTVSALLGSLFGYVLGSAAHSAKPSQPSPSTGGGSSDTSGGHGSA